MVGKEQFFEHSVHTPTHTHRSNLKKSKLSFFIQPDVSRCLDGPGLAISVTSLSESKFTKTYFNGLSYFTFRTIKE